MVLSNEQEITELSKGNTHIYQFYQHFYIKKYIYISEDSIRFFTYYGRTAILRRKLNRERNFQLFDKF